MNQQKEELKSVIPEEIKVDFLKKAQEVFKTNTTKIFFQGLFSGIKLDLNVKFKAYEGAEYPLAISSKLPYVYNHMLPDHHTTTSIYLSLFKSDQEDIIIVSKIPIVPLKFPKYHEYFSSWNNLSSGWFGNNVLFGEFSVSNRHQPTPVFGEMVRSELLTVKKDHLKTLLKVFNFTPEQSVKVISDIMSLLTDNLLFEMKEVKDKNMKLFMKLFFFREKIDETKERIIFIPVFAFGNKTLHTETHKVLSYDNNLPVLV